MDLERFTAKALSTLREPHWFRTPGQIAEEVGVTFRMTPQLPGLRSELTDGNLVLVRWHDDQRERGTRLFRGIASVLLERTCGGHTPVESYFLASRLAAPPRLVNQAGLDEAIRCQTWIRGEFLRAWYSIG